MNTIKKVLVAMGLVFAAQGVAQAGPIVTSWNYTLTGEWTTATYTNGTGTPGGFQPAATTTTSSLLSWGVPASTEGQSSLSIHNPDANSVVNTFIGAAFPPLPPPAFIAEGSTLTHTNHPIFAPTLLATTLKATLALTTLTPPPGGTPAPGLNPLVFNIGFVETTNATPCASTSPAGNPCNDIFVLTSQTFQDQQFTLDGNTYFVNVFPTSANALSKLTDAECAAAGQPAGCIGFTTQENAVTNLPFGFTVTTEPIIPPDVPEPGSLALMGLGLMGFAAASRKRKIA